MATRYEYYNTGDDAGLIISNSAHWRGQTFTPAIAHKITSVKLYLGKRNLSPGDITVSIKATTDDHPSGEDLCVGTTDGNTLPEGESYEWREITLGAGYNLEADTKYAIVISCAGADDSNYFYWRSDNSDPTYDGGWIVYSNNSGGTWSSITTADFMFEDWGEPLYTLHEWTGSDGIALSDALIKRWSQHYERVFSDAIAFTDIVTRYFERVFTDGIKYTDVLTKVWTHGVLRILKAVRNLPSIREDGTKR